MVWKIVHLNESCRRFDAGYCLGEELDSVTVNIVEDQEEHECLYTRKKILLKECIVLEYGYKRYRGNNLILTRIL